MLADTIVAAAIQSTPLTTRDLDRWQAHLYPLDVASEVRAWAGLVPGRAGHSTCGVHALACYREGGVDGRIVWRGTERDVVAGPYAPLSISGGAIAVLRALGDAHGATRLASEAGDVVPGAVIVVDEHNPHAIVVTSVGLATSGYVPLVTSEGGQVDDHGSTAVRERARELREVATGAWVVRDRGATGQGRRVLFWIDPARLVSR